MAIAEACGWKNIAPAGRAPWFKQDGYLQIIDLPPDYPSDLNAMHNAENQCNENGLSLIRYHDLLIKEHGTLGAITATAAQKAEAFLKTIGKWDDSK